MIEKNELQFDWSKLDPNNLDHPELHISRELSWFEFNQRVLDQAYNESHPLLERVKFLSIVSSNLDEFFMVRLSTILKKLNAGIEDVTPDGFTTQQHFESINLRTHRMLGDMKRCWSEFLRPALAEKDIHFWDLKDYNEAITIHLKNYFLKDIYPVLTPLAFDPSHPFPHISNLSMNFAVVVNHNDQTKFARVKIPSILQRFIPIPQELTGKPGIHFAFLEDVIQKNMDILFPGTQIENSYLFRVIRDTDLVIQEDEAGDLLKTVDQGLKQVRWGAVSLLRIHKSMPERILNILTENFQVNAGVIHPTDGRMALGDFISLLKLHLPQLKDKPFSPRMVFDEEEGDALFERIRFQDYLVHHPYDSFGNVETFIKVAVNDPSVVAIKMTLYRIGSNSPLVDQLIQAVEAGKQVAVLVELKARFDERNNILWAKRLEAAGAHVVYGMLKLKTHCKLCLVVRKEGDTIRRYAHIGTGNYNRSTAQIYTDLGLFTSNEQICDDVSEVFNFLTGYSNQKKYRKLLVAPNSLRSGIESLIEREIQNAKEGKEARIILKINALADVKMVRMLYRASQAGVKIQMIIRGFCCLRPGVPGFSENIKISSIVGRFLEHHRIYYFFNGGQEEIYFGSADLMERNLDRRVEVVCPVLDPKIKDHIKNQILDLMLSDNVQAYDLLTDGNYKPVTPEDASETISSQIRLLDYYTNLDNTD